MMKQLYTIACMLLTTAIFCQSSTLQQNINPRANELKHNLNSAGDTLFLEGERTIYKVEIFNVDFDRVIQVRDTKVTIPLNDIPVGRFVVEATLIDKLIVITLLRNTPIDPANPLSLPSLEITELSKALTAPQKPVITIDKLRFKEIQKTKLAGTDKTSLTKLNKSAGSKINSEKKESKSLMEKPKVLEVTETNPVRKSQNTYWIVYKVNSSASSGREMQMGDKRVVDRMIRRNKLDIKTLAGKNNELTIWEVYDVTKFMKYKRKQSNDVSNASESDFFNVVPVFTTEKNLRNP